MLTKSTCLKYFDVISAVLVYGFFLWETTFALSKYKIGLDFRLYSDKYISFIMIEVSWSVLLIKIFK